jgi:putative transposase
MTSRDTSSPGSFARPWPPPTSTDTLHLALQASGLDKVGADRRPRLLSDNGPSYAPNDLSDWLEGQGKKHTREKPYHPMTQGKIERWHLSLKSPILLESYYADFVEHYNHRRYHDTSTTSRPLTSTSAEASASSSGESTSSVRTIEQRRDELQPDGP